jgi:Protein of Unknown function (DUF2784)
MIYGIFADVVIIVHLFWILFLIAGAYWGSRYRPVMIIHGAGLIFALVSQRAGWNCPLTVLEVWLREKHNTAQAYPGSFIAHYAEKLVYIDLSPGIVFALTLALVGATLWTYWRVFRRTVS